MLLLALGGALGGAPLRAQDAVPVAVEVPAPAQVSEELRLTGTLTAERSARLSPRVDGLLDEAARSPDRELRRERYRAVLGQMLGDLPVIPLFHEAQVAALSPRAASFRLSAEGRWLSLAQGW